MQRISAPRPSGRFNDIEERTGDTNRAIQSGFGSKNNPVVISESQATRDVVMIGVARWFMATFRKNLPANGCSN
jgi:hypothetical protein